MSRVRRVSTVLLWAALAWGLGTCLYVYLVRHGEEAFRVETAVFAVLIVSAPLLAGGRRRSSPGTADPVGFEPPPGGRASVAVAALATALWLIVLLPLFDLPFISDDYGLLDVYRSLADVTTRIQYFRPVFGATFVGLSHLGWSPAIFRSAGMAGHFASALLVYSIARRAGLAREHAVLGFAVFLLNPVQLEAVIWPAAIADVLWTFFVLAAIRCYVGARELSVGRLVATAALAAAALGSKEPAICFVPLLAIADWTLYRMRRGPLVGIAYLVFISEMAAYFAVRSRFAGLYATGLFTAPSRFFVKQFVSTPYKVFAQPWARPPVEVPTIVACAIAMGLIALLFLTLQSGRGSRLAVGASVIFLSTLPLIAFLAVFPNLRASRYIYFASAGWAAVMVELFQPLVARRRGFVATLALCGGLAWLLELNTKPWRVAGDVVAAMHEHVAAGGDGLQAAHDWQERTGHQLRFVEGVPVAYEGVDVFLNGYPEFVSFARGTLKETRVRR